MIPPEAGDHSALNAPIEVTSVDRVDGPLLFVSGADGVGWDEYVEIRLANGETRHGIVVEVDNDLAIIEVFEGTDGIGTANNLVAFSGAPCRFRSPSAGWDASATVVVNRSTAARLSPGHGADPSPARPSTPRTATSPEIRCSPEFQSSMVWPHSCAVRNSRFSQ